MLRCHAVMIALSPGRGGEPAGDGVRTVRVQGPSDLQHPGNAGEGSRRTAPPLCGHCCRQRPRGRLQGRQDCVLVKSALLVQDNHFTR